MGQSFILLFQERAAVLIPSCHMQKPEFSLLYFFISMILDIHAAAKEIAEVNEINLEKIWDMLLEKWLCPSTMPGEVSVCSQPKYVVPQELSLCSQDTALLRGHRLTDLASHCCSNTSAPRVLRL